MNKGPRTTAIVRVHSQNFKQKVLQGEVTAGDFKWNFIWKFTNGDLLIEPSLGRALIEDALLRFLIKADYSLEPGGDYMFVVRARF